MRHFYLDQYSNIDSFIHRLDPRIKVICFFMYILFVIFTKPSSYISFAMYGIMITGLILLSRISLLFIFKRSLVVIPFVLLVAISIPFFKKGQIVGNYSLGAVKLNITSEGLAIFWNCLIKSYLSILCMILLVSSTTFSDLLKALEKLKLPKLIIMVLSFMYRYIFIFQDELMKMWQAKEARSVGGSKICHIKVLANMIGTLFIRAYERGEQVYLAMCSRGFDGQMRTINRFQLKRLDLFFFLMMMVLLTGIKVLGG